MGLSLFRCPLPFLLTLTLWFFNPRVQQHNQQSYALRSHHTIESGCFIIHFPQLVLFTQTFYTLFLQKILPIMHLSHISQFFLSLSMFQDVSLSYMYSWIITSNSNINGSPYRSNFSFSFFYVEVVFQ